MRNINWVKEREKWAKKPRKEIVSEIIHLSSEQEDLCAEIESLKAEFRSIDAFATMCPDDSHAVLLEVMQMVRRAAAKNDARPSAKSSQQ